MKECNEEKYGKERGGKFFSAFCVIVIAAILLFYMVTFAYKVPECEPDKLDMIPRPVTDEVMEEVKSVLSEYSHTRFLVVGNSMLPAMKENDWCVCTLTEDYEMGDIIVYRPEFLQDMLVAHRIVNKAGDWYIVAGDNNNVRDPLSVQKKDVLCEIRQVPLIVKWLRKDLGGFLL